MENTLYNFGHWNTATRLDRKTSTGTWLNYYHLSCKGIWDLCWLGVIWCVSIQHEAGFLLAWRLPFSLLAVSNNMVLTVQGRSTQVLGIQLFSRELWSSWSVGLVNFLMQFPQTFLVLGVIVSLKFACHANFSILCLWPKPGLYLMSKMFTAFSNLQFFSPTLKIFGYFN